MSENAYVYRLIDRQTGLQYIGCRFANNCHPSDLGVTYFTSSKLVFPIFKKNPERFERQIIVTGDAEYVIKVEKTMLDFYDAVLSDQYYNRTNGRAIHPKDRLEGAYKEHAKRSPELYAKIVRKMISKTTHEHRVKAALAAYNKMTPEERLAKMKMMRSKKTADSINKTKIASIKRANENPKLMSEMGKLGGRKGGPIACKITNSQKWQCEECGMITLPGPLGKHQARKNHKGKRRVQ